MKLYRVLCLAGALVLGASVAIPEAAAQRGRDRGDTKPSNGSSKGDQGSRPRSGPSGGSDQGSRPRGDSGPKPRNDSPPPKSDQGPRPRNDSPPRPRNDSPPPRSDQGPRPRNDSPPPRSDQGPRPRNDSPPPKSDNDQRVPPPRGETGPRPRNEIPPRRNDDDGQRPRGDQSSRPPIRNNDDGPRPGDRGGDRKPDFEPPRSPGNRIERNDNQGSRPQRGSDNMLGRRGGNAYGGQINNLNRDGRSARPVSIQRAPIDIFRGGLEHQVRREDRVRIANRNWRVGYHHYYNNWCDDFFWFNYYIFDPFRSSHCYVSPWYYYPHLPAYVNPRCVSIVTINLSPWYGTYYQWNRPYYGQSRYDYSPLDYAVDDLTRAFEDVDRRSLRRLIPYSGRIAIFVDNEYTYSMEPEDFENFMLDAIEGTRTTRYEVTRVERRGNEAQIEARHEYEDPWGRRTVVYHSYRLEYDRGNYVITRFGTSFGR